MRVKSVPETWLLLQCMWVTDEANSLLKTPWITDLSAVPWVVQCGPQEMSTHNPYTSVQPEWLICKCKWTVEWKSCPSHSSSPYAASGLCLVSTWRTLRTLRRMFLDRGLPRKINLRLTSSASRGVSRPHHLTQCSSHEHEHHAWVAMQERGTLFGVLSEGKTKAMRKKSKSLILLLFHHTDRTPWFINLHLLGLRFLSLGLK